MRGFRELLTETFTLKGATVVEVGCGDGSLARALARQGARVIGVEVSEEQLHGARKLPPVSNEEYRIGQADHLPVEDGGADVVLYFNSLHHVPQGSMGAALLEAARVLRPGGVLAVTEPLGEEGSLFHVLSPLEDETEVRAAALEALTKPPPSLVPEREIFYTARRAYPDVEAFLIAATAPDPERRRKLPEVESELRALFQRHGRQEKGASVFSMPLRLNTLKRVKGP